MGTAHLCHCQSWNGQVLVPLALSALRWATREELLCVPKSSALMENTIYRWLNAAQETESGTDRWEEPTLIIRGRFLEEVDSFWHMSCIRMELLKQVS